MKYDTRQSFLQWIYQPLVTRKSTVILTGLTWYQCKHYARFGSHSGLECNKNGTKKAKARAMIIAVKKSTVHIDSSNKSIASVESWDSNDSSKPSSNIKKSGSVRNKSHRYVWCNTPPYSISISNPSEESSDSD